MDVSVLVPVLNEERYIRDTVAAMQAQRFEGSLEFLFMDGRSEDRTKAILEELAAADPRIRVFDNPGRSSTAGLNVGLRNARGDYIVRMDAHTFYPVDYIARGVERLRQGDVVWVAGPQVPYGVGKWSRRVALALGSWFGTGGSARWGAGGDGAVPTGKERELDTGVFAGLWRRSTVEEHSGWDEGWPINQDSELAARVLRSGGRIVSIPALAARYVPRNSLRGLARQYWRYGNYRAKTAVRHPESLGARHLFAPVLAVATVGAFVGPDPVRPGSRAALAVYAGTVAVASARALPRAGLRDAATLPVVFTVMHGAWGFGFLAGSVRFGTAARRARADRAPEPPHLAGVRVRLAVYTDYVYRREGGAVYAERAFALFLAGLAEHVDRLVIVGRLDPRSGASHYRLPESVEFVPLPHYPSLVDARRSVPAMVRSLARFWRVLRDVDTVWLLGPYALSILFAGTARLRGRRVALGVRQDLPRYVQSRHPGRRWVHAAALVLEGTYRALARRWPVVVVGPDLAHRYRRARRVLAITVSLVPREQIASEADAAARNWDGELVALSVGRLDREKNPLLLADVLARLRERDPRWRLVVAGEGPLEGALRERLRELGVEAAADVRGYVPIDGGLPELYRSSHAFLHVSWTEGLPQVLFEAFAAGLPVVATEVGGVPAAVGDAALLVPPGDADRPAEALARLGADAELRERLGAAGLARVREHTLEAECRRVAEFLAEG